MTLTDRIRTATTPEDFTAIKERIEVLRFQAHMSDDYYHCTLPELEECDRMEAYAKERAAALSIAY